MHLTVTKNCVKVSFVVSLGANEIVERFHFVMLICHKAGKLQGNPGLKVSRVAKVHLFVDSNLLVFFEGYPMQPRS